MLFLTVFELRIVLPVPVNEPDINVRVTAFNF